MKRVEGRTRRKPSAAARVKGRACCERPFITLCVKCGRQLCARHAQMARVGGVLRCKGSCSSNYEDEPETLVPCARAGCTRHAARGRLCRRHAVAEAIALARRRK